MNTLQTNQKSKTQGKITKARKTANAMQSHALLLSGSLLMNVLPRTLRRTLRYAQTFSLTTGAAGLVGTVQSMMLNSCYDPNYSGTGHQPYGYDQIVQFYQQYFVHSCRYTLICNTIGGTAEVCVCLQIFPTAGGVSIAGISTDAATEKSTVSTFPVGSSGNVRTRSVSGEVKIAQIFGLTPAQYAAQTDVYGAAVTSNPSLGAYLEVGIGSYSGTAGESLAVQIILDQDVEFWQPKTLSQS
jgi:hypothetical protein